MNASIKARNKPLILVVDAELVNRMLIQKALQNEGYDVITAENGQQALELTILQAPSVIIMDAIMPIMDGREACAAIHKQEKGLHTPILMLTSIDDVDSIEALFNLGATDFIIKPINLSLLCQRIRIALRTQQTDIDLYQHQRRQAHANKVARMGYWDWDITNNYLYWSDEVYDIFSITPGDYSNNREAFMAITDEDDQEKIKFATKQSLKFGIPYSIDHRVIRADKQIQIVHQDAELFRNESGEVVRMLGIVQDITEKHLAQEKIQHQAFFDSLTDLPNRTLFHDRLDHALEISSRTKKEVAVFIINLDRFKNINESLGHKIGDKFLQSVTDRLLQTTRKSDTVARIGGDEFAVIAEGIPSLDGVTNVANKLLHIMSQAHYIDENELFSTASIGIAISSKEACDKKACDNENLIKQADLAMIHAKGSGGNRYCFYNEEMKSQAYQSLILEKELRHALAQDELVVYYQPKVNVATGKIKGMEALIRWQHTKKGIVSPLEFIPIAEETGLIVPIGQWVLEQACKQTKAWHDKGYTDLVISINVSTRQFHQLNFVSEVESAINKSGINPNNVDLEITESCTMNNIESAIRLLKALRKTGISISLDDFGTGFSSLSFLNQLPLDTLKVDRAFIKDINAKRENSELARLIIAMAKSLSLNVVAEGIETEDHLEFLQENVCDEFQGFLFSRPLPADEFENLLIENLSTSAEECIS